MVSHLLPGKRVGESLYMTILCIYSGDAYQVDFAWFVSSSAAYGSCQFMRVARFSGLDVQMCVDVGRASHQLPLLKMFFCCSYACSGIQSETAFSLALQPSYFMRYHDIVSPFAQQDIVMKALSTRTCICIYMSLLGEGSSPCL